MKKYVLEVSQNEWEYIGYTTIECNELIRDEENNKIVYADSIKIEFDEEIGSINGKP